MVAERLLLGIDGFYIFGLAAFVAFLLAWTLNLRNGRSKSGQPLPPGPKPLPFIGNVKDLPQQFGWLVYARWKKQYGDIIYASAFGTPVVILNSSEAVIEFLEKRSAIYSDRSWLPMLNEMVGWEEWAFPFMRYGETWRRHRKAFHQYFSSTASQRYYTVHILESRRTLQRLLATPNEFRHHMSHLAAATIMRITYGIDVQDANDKFIKIGEAAMDSVAKAGTPGAFLVDTFPIRAWRCYGPYWKQSPRMRYAVKYVPSWMPGAGFKRQAAKWRQATEAHITLAFDHMADGLAKGNVEPSMASDMLQAAKSSLEPDAEMFARQITAVSYAGGSDTTTSIFASFFMAMVLYPDMQRKAQEELDAVLGGTRLPEFSDRPFLPYIEATVKEVHRWQPVAPLGNPHASIKDDVYKGYYIPKGSVIQPNVWAILHDEDTFPNPEDFNPDRFLKDGKINPDILNPERFAFGFGRRICPGRHMANNSMFIAIASVLSCFDIKPAIDAHGQPIAVEVKMSPGFISTFGFPGPFDCSIEPRNVNVPSLIARGLQPERD